MTGRGESDIQRLIAQCEIRVPRTFALWRETNWGLLYYAPYNPNSHDSNHAVVLDPDADLDDLLEEVIAFYRGLGISPRVYPTFVEGEWERMAPALARHGFQMMPEEPTVAMLHDGETYHPPADVGMDVRRVRKVDSSLLRLIHAKEHQEWTEGVIRRRVQREDQHLFVGYVQGEAVTMAVLGDADVLAHVDHVLTAPAHRRKGYNLNLMRHLVRCHRDRSDKPLYLFSDNPAAVRNYERVGFRTLDGNWAYTSAFVPDEE